MLVVFRTDASPRTGLGHLRRCLSLAQALKAIGVASIFLCRPSSIDIAGILEAEGIPLRWLDSTPLDDEAALDSHADARVTLAAMSGLDAPDWIIVDHYRLEASWHALIKSALDCQIAAIDDLANRKLDVDLLIDHNLAPSGEQKRRYRAVLASEPKWLCGPRFALLGQTYSGLPEFVVKPEVSSIGIFLGGTDPSHHSPISLKAIRKSGFLGRVEIVSTSGNPSLQLLQAAVNEDSNAELLLDLPDLCAFNQRHDALIGAGGGAAWERCAVGVPTVTLCLADNQKAVIPMLVELEATLSPSRPTAEEISKEVSRLISDRSLRQSLSNRSRALVDGLGAARVAISIAAEGGFNLRKATLADAHQMWTWRNAPSIRTVSRQTTEIPFADHSAWLTRSLASEQRFIWIAETGTRSIGVIRFDTLATSGHFEVSLYLDPTLQGLGLGRKLLLSGEQELARKARANTIEAEVLAENTASHNMFVATGYVQTTPGRYVKKILQA